MERGRRLTSFLYPTLPSEVEVGGVGKKNLDPSSCPVGK